MNALVDHTIATEELEIIEFYLEETNKNGELYRGYYGMNVAKVLEIIRRPSVTGVPSKRHSAALGTFNLRGRVLPLVDLGIWLGKKTIDNEHTKVIVSEFSNIVTAFLVSGVTRIHRLSWSQVESPNTHMQSYTGQSITGVVRIDDRIVFILDLEHIMTSMIPASKMDTLLPTERIVPEGQIWRVLLADDSSSIRNLISTTLGHGGFTVTTTNSGKEAWAQLQQWKDYAQKSNVPITKYVELIVSDIEMPEMDGHTLTKFIKADPVLGKLPVILFSSLITEALQAKGKAIGADGQVSKPDLPTLAHRVGQFIEKNRRKK